MIDKTEAQTEGYQVVDSSTNADEERLSKLEALKSLVPSFLNSDGAVDVSSIVDFVEPNSTTANNKGYELTFAGKGLARYLSDTETKKELKAEPKQSKNFDETGNVIIRGDNLDALKILRQGYYSKIKMIYIDPPYNTQNDDFIYADNFKQSTEGLMEHLKLEQKSLDYIDNMYGTKTHSGWLAFMYPRLKLARDLLTGDGVIFISIDDNEQANLKIICDEIFGKENNEMMVWHKVTDDSGKMKRTHRFRREHEYILVCYKNKQEVFFDKYLSDRNYKNEYSNPDNDSRGAYKQGIMSYTEEKSNLKSKNYYSITTPGGRVIKRQWRFTKEEFEKLNDEGRIYYGKEGNSIPSIKVFINEQKETTPMSILDGFGTAKTAGTEIENLLGERDIFLNPKPTDLIRHIINIAAKTGIILDFFAGSGTTAQAVMEINKEDEGKRKFILIQWDEKINQNNKPAYDFCKKNKLKPVISSICIERVHRAGEKIKDESDMLNQGVDVGYKVFSLTDKPQLKEIESQPQLSHQRHTTQDTLYNMIAASGQDLLTDPIEIIEPDMLYKINDAHYVLGECESNLKTAGKVFIDGYANISLERWLNMLGLNKEGVTILY